MTKESMIEILRDISEYPLIIEHIDGRKYVQLKDIEYLKSLARQGLNSRADLTDKPKRHYVR